MRLIHYIISHFLSETRVRFEGHLVCLFWESSLVFPLIRSGADVSLACLNLAPAGLTWENADCVNLPDTPFSLLFPGTVSQYCSK